MDFYFEKIHMFQLHLLFLVDYLYNSTIDGLGYISPYIVGAFAKFLRYPLLATGSIFPSCVLPPFIDLSKQ